VSSDSRATMGFVSYEVRKIYPVVLRVKGDEVPLAVAGGSGDAALVKQAYRLCERVLIDLAKSRWGGSTPSFEQFEEAVSQIESSLMSRLRELRGYGVEPEFAMILASVDPDGRASIYLFNDRGLAEPVHDNPGFAVIGSGFFTGGNLLLRILGYAPEESGALDLGALSVFIIDVMSEIDPHVGPFIGESYLMRVERTEEGSRKVVLGPLKEEAIKEYKEKAKKRKELIRLLWRLLDEAGEEAVEGKLRELEEELKKRGQA